MAGTLTRGYTFGAVEEVTAAKLHALVDDGTISGVTADEIASGTITDDKISSVSGAKFITLANIPTGAGVIPKANLTSVAQKGANSDITSLSGLTTPLSTAQGGTGSTANANAASGVVVLDASSKLPAVDGSQLTNISTSFGAWVDKSSSYGAQQAATDGFVCATSYDSGESSADIIGYTDANANPTTIRAHNKTNVSVGGGTYAYIMFPVKKGDYWKVENNADDNSITVYWIPL